MLAAQPQPMDAVLPVGKVAPAVPAKENKVVEPLLTPDPNRFSLFPIQYHEVRRWCRPGTDLRSSLGHRSQASELSLTLLRGLAYCRFAGLANV